MILFRRSDEVLHAIGWTSMLTRRVACSTIAAEFLVAVDDTNKLTNFKHFVKKNLGTRAETPELILDSLSALHICSTLKVSEEANNKLLLASIKEEYHRNWMSVNRWTPESTHRADAVTKDSREIAERLDDVFELGIKHHSDTSCVATYNVLGPIHSSDEIVKLFSTHMAQRRHHRTPSPPSDIK